MFDFSKHQNYFLVFFVFSLKRSIFFSGKMSNSCIMSHIPKGLSFAQKKKKIVVLSLKFYIAEQ